MTFCFQIQRTIAYGETKRDIEKWALTVKKNREVKLCTYYSTNNFVEVVLGVKIKSQLETEPAIIVMTGWNTLTLNYPSSVNYKQETCTQLTWGSLV